MGLVVSALFFLGTGEEVRYFLGLLAGPDPMGEDLAAEGLPLDVDGCGEAAALAMLLDLKCVFFCT